MSAQMPSVVLLAHGRGLRLHSVTGGANKCLVTLGGSTSIAANALAGIVLAGVQATATVRTGDPAAERLAAMDGVERVVTCDPTGFLHDVARLSVARPDLLVIESDIVGRPIEMARAIRALIASTSQYTFTVASLPPSDDPRSIRPVVADDGGFGLSSHGLVPRLCGLYRFRPGATAEMRSFAATRRGTFHDFMEHLAGQRRLSCRLVEVPTAFNVNWPDDLAAARRWYGGAVRPAATDQAAEGSAVEGSR